MKKILVLLFLVFSLFAIGCKQEKDIKKDDEPKDKIVLNYKEVMLEGESFTLSIKEGDDTIFAIDTDDLDLVQIKELKVKALKQGTATLTVMFEKSDPQVLTIRIDEFIAPTGVSIRIIEKGPYDLDHTYHYEAKLYPSNASVELKISYYNEEVILNEDDCTIGFLKAGVNRVIVYPAGYGQLQEVLEVNVVPGKEEYYSIMFIGNSFTYYRDIPAMVYNMIKADDVKVYVNSDTEGGRYLYQALDNFNKDFNGKFYTHVILQEQSGGMISNFTQFRDSILEYYDRIDTDNVEIILYQTWSDENYLLSNDKSRQDLITKAYNDVASLIGSKVSRVGEAFFAIHEKYSEIDLYKEDEEIGHHQNEFGAYLSACIHYRNITGRKAQDVKYIPSAIDEESAKKIQEIADSMFGD